MKTATLRDLRYDFSKIEAWLRSGEEVQITKRSKPFCRVVPDTAAAPPEAVSERPDFDAFRTRVWGRRQFSQEEIEEARVLETGEP